jgi:hypothetical protein
MLAKCNLGAVCYLLCVYFIKKLEKITISESRQPDGGISHLERENLLLHMVRGGGRGLEALAGKFDLV